MDLAGPFGCATGHLTRHLRVFGCFAQDIHRWLREANARARPSDHQDGRDQVARSAAKRARKVLVISEEWCRLPSRCARSRAAVRGGQYGATYLQPGRQEDLGTRRPDPAAAPDANHDLMLSS